MVQRIILSLYRLGDLSFKLKNFVIFSDIALATVSLPPCVLLAGDMRNCRMCHRPGERAAFLPCSISSEMA